MTQHTALKEGVNEKIREINDEKRKLELSLGSDGLVSREEVESRLKECRVILESFAALETIEKDLQLFAEQLNSTDDSVKQTAQTFSGEFTKCKIDIENQLNSIL